MKFFVLGLLALLPIYSSAATISCYGWYQINGGDIETIPMSVTGKTANSETFSATYKGYVYTADWNFELTSFYISFETNGKRILTTTARVPTDNHPENFTDLNLPDGPRLSITCESK